MGREVSIRLRWSLRLKAALLPGGLLTFAQLLAILFATVTRLSRGN